MTIGSVAGATPCLHSLLPLRTPEGEAAGGGANFAEQLGGLVFPAMDVPASAVCTLWGRLGSSVRLAGGNSLTPKDGIDQAMKAAIGFAVAAAPEQSLPIEDGGAMSVAQPEDEGLVAEEAVTATLNSVPQRAVPVEGLVTGTVAEQTRVPGDDRSLTVAAPIEFASVIERGATHSGLVTADSSVESTLPLVSSAGPARWDTENAAHEAGKPAEPHATGLQPAPVPAQQITWDVAATRTWPVIASVGQTEPAPAVAAAIRLNEGKRTADAGIAATEDAFNEGTWTRLPADGAPPSGKNPEASRSGEPVPPAVPVVHSMPAAPAQTFVFDTPEANVAKADHSKSEKEPAPVIDAAVAVRKLIDPAIDGNATVAARETTASDPSVRPLKASKHEDALLTGTSAAPPVAAPVVPPVAQKTASPVRSEVVAGSPLVEMSAAAPEMSASATPLKPATVGPDPVAPVTGKPAPLAPAEAPDTPAAAFLPPVRSTVNQIPPEPVRATESIDGASAAASVSVRPPTHDRASVVDAPVALPMLPQTAAAPAPISAPGTVTESFRPASNEPEEVSGRLSQTARPIMQRPATNLGEMAFAARIEPIGAALRSELNSEGSVAPPAFEPQKALDSDIATPTPHAPAGWTAQSPLNTFETNIENGPTPRATPPPSVPSAEMSEPPATGNLKPAPPIKEISLQVTQPGKDKVELHVVQHAGEVRVSVHSGDSDLLHGLRQGLSDLVDRLEENGYRAETWRPGVSAEPQASASQNHSSPGDPRGGNGQSHSGGTQQDGGRQNQNAPHQPRWVEELETSLTGAAETSGEFHGFGN